MLQLLIPKALAEMIGTFAIVFVGAGSIVLAEKNLIPGFSIPIAWGLIITLMIVLMGPVSGAHFNPVVTLAFAVAKRFPVAQVSVYWGSQLIGGLTAIILLGVLKNI